jgi:hypothetical protein
LHFACLVVGPDPDRQLEPFAGHLEVPRYKRFPDHEDVVSMAEHFSLPATDLHALAARLPEWEQAEGGVEDGRLFVWTTANPNSRFDWYEVGGRFAGCLQLQAPPQPSALKRLFGAKPTSRVNQARKAEIVQAPLLSDPPAALLRDAVWVESPITSDTAELQKWKERFAELFAAIPDDELLTIVDLHQ